MSAVESYVNEVANEVAHAYDETRPLLHDRDAPSASRRGLAPTPLPTAQLTTLCAIRLADPIAFTQIFPYVNEMMDNFGVATNPSQVGFYSGLVESVFALSQLISIYQWAQLSDKIGRRPVVFLGTIGIALTTIQFGLSRTLAGVLIARFLAGLFSGNVAVMHSVLGELTDSTNQAIAFPIYGLCWPLGIIIGPLIGGTFSNPADKYPKWFDNDLFRMFPYLLPCAVTAFVSIVAVAVGFYCLEETLPGRRRRSEKELSISYGAATHKDDLLCAGPPPTAKALLSIPVIRSLCASGCALSFIGTSFDVVFVLFCYSPVSTGGLAFSASEIGYALAIAGTSSAAIQLFVMPYLLRTFSSCTLYKVCMALWPYTFLFLPILNLLARMGYDESTGAVDEKIVFLVWIGVGCSLAMSRVACLAYSLNMILVKEYAPGPSALGAANGLAQFSQCLARAISPTFVSCLFAFSVDYNIMGGHLWVILMFLMSLISWILAGALPEGSKVMTDTDKHAFLHGV